MPTTKPAAPRTRRKSLDVTLAQEARSLPLLQPNYPVKPWVDARSGLFYHTVSVELDGGAFLCIIAEFPKIRVTAPTQADAERAAVRLYQRRQAKLIEGDAEDADDLRVIKSREKEPCVSLGKVLAQYGR